MLSPGFHVISRTRLGLCHEQSVTRKPRRLGTQCSTTREALCVFRRVDHVPCGAHTDSRKNMVYVLVAGRGGRQLFHRAQERGQCLLQSVDRARGHLPVEERPILDPQRTAAFFNLLGAVREQEVFFANTPLTTTDATSGAEASFSLMRARKVCPRTLA